MSNKATAKPKNKTLFQAFEWYLDDGGQHWKRLEKNAELLKALRINMAWLPPAYKGMNGPVSVGYDVYDKYDLGQFPQKGTTATKYGTRKDYEDMLKKFRENRIDALADIVVNHMFGGDEEETLTVMEYNPNDRTQTTSEWFERSFNTRFTFTGRMAEEYADVNPNPDQWDASFFSGVDWDEEKWIDGKVKDVKHIYKIQDREFAEDVDWEYVNYDFLMGANLDYSNEQTAQRVIDWGKWYLDEVGDPDFGIEGFRIDAVKHISNQFMKNWLAEMRKHAAREDLFAVGEYWSGETLRLLNYLDSVEDSMSLFDVPLHFALKDAAESSSRFDMRLMFHDTLFGARPNNSVLFVDNHDTQPGQALTSYILSWFKRQAYALILFQKEGVPCVFYGDLFGLNYENYDKDMRSREEKKKEHIKRVDRNEFAPVRGLPKMCRTRCTCAHGTLKPYYGNRGNTNETSEQEGQIIGYTRAGESKYKYSGMAVLVTNGKGGTRNMYVNVRYAGEEFVDILNPETPYVKLDSHGSGDFTVRDGDAAVWVRKTAYEYLVKQKGFLDYVELL